MTLDTAVLADLAAKATPGPWWVEAGPRDEPEWPDTEIVAPGDPPEVLLTGQLSERADAALIVAAVNALPALLSEVETLRNLVRELAETVHQTGSLRDHADPNDLTGWNVHGIETCEDSLCVDARAALVSEEGSRTR